MSATVTKLTGSFDEAAILSTFAREGLTPNRWSNAPGDVYAAHTHAYHKVLYCLRGSITFRLANADDITLKPGDRLDIEPRTVHAAIVGPEGVTCIEAAPYA